MQAQWVICLGLVAGTFVYAYRAYRFGVHYARELYVQFLVLADPATPAPVKAKK
jgi:hypothetical protein